MTGREHGPCSRAVNTDIQHGCHFRHPYSRAVLTAGQHGPWTRVDGPCSRVHTGIFDHDHYC